MDDYDENFVEDHNPEECLHGVYWMDYCEDCIRVDTLYEKAQEQSDWNHWHPIEDTE